MIRSRPRDRKVQIAQAAQDAFGALGYHTVSMDDIAARVGITPGALYRHSPSKYALFRDAVLSFGNTLLDRTAFVGDLHASAKPRETLRHLIVALVDVALEYRDVAGLYRWESRFLRDEDLATADGQMRLLHERVAELLRRQRPTLLAEQIAVLSAAALSVIGSVADHRNALAIDDIRTAMVTMVTDILRATLPAGLGRSERPRGAWPAVPPAAGIYEVVLIESMQLFYQRGYQGTTMDDIAAAAHTTVPALYKHFTTKSDILVSSYRRATDRISADVSVILTETTTARGALQRLIASCVNRNLANPELSFVYYSERHNLPDADAQILNALRQSVVDAWARLVVETRPDFTLGMARYAVLGAFALTVDPGRMLLDSADSHIGAATVRRLMASVLLGTR